MKAVIPIGGRGTRLRPLTFSANKHFIPVANKPLIFYPIETVAQAGIKNIAITYNTGQLDYAKEFLGDGSRWGVKLTYILQEKPLGVANIFQVCEDWVGDEPFVLHLGDNIFTQGIREFVEHFEKHKPHGLIALVHHPENFRLGVPYFDKKGRLIKYVEKPKNPPHDFAIPGLYFFDKKVFKCFKGKNKIQPSERGEYEIGSPYQWLLERGHKVDTLELKGQWLDPGKFNDWLETNRYLLDHYTETKIESKIGKGAKIEGRVTIGKNCRIINSTVRGPVNIGDNVLVKDSLIGPFTSVYHHCRIISCRLENSVLMENVSLEHLQKIIESSIIGSHSRISGQSAGRQAIELFVGELSKIYL